jgi:YidC/Oxa1 family membrane protein insertase
MEIFNIFAPFWNAIFIQPLVNVIVVTYALLGHNFVLAVLTATILVQLVTWPLTMKSVQSSKKMSALQQSAEWKDAQKKYKNDREKMAQVTMALYKEHGINPASGCVPTLIQMPLLIAFYSSINLLLAVNPDSLLDLTGHLYRNIGFIADIAKTTIPLQSQFLWLNLARPDPFYIMPVLVAGSTWISQKTMSMPSADPQASAMNNQMQVMMPLMFGFFALQFPSGLAAYWIISSLVRMTFQGMTQGWKGVLPSGLSMPKFLQGAANGSTPKTSRAPAALPKAATIAKSTEESSTPPPSAPLPLPKKIAPVSSGNGNANGSSRKRARRQSRR